MPESFRKRLDNGCDNPASAWQPRRLLGVSALFQLLPAKVPGFGKFQNFLAPGSRLSVLAPFFPWGLPGKHFRGNPKFPGRANQAMPLAIPTGILPQTVPEPFGFAGGKIGIILRDGSAILQTEVVQIFRLFG